jgi:hypothetical protein
MHKKRVLIVFKTLFRTCVNYRNISKNGNSGDDDHILHVLYILKLPMRSIWLKVLILQISVS